MLSVLHLLQRGPANVLVAIAYFVDTFGRLVDFLFFRNIGAGITRKWKLANLQGHSIAAVVLPFLLLVPFLVFNQGNLLLWLLKVVVIEILILCYSRWMPLTWLTHPLNFQIAILAGMSALSHYFPEKPWSFGGPVQGSAGIREGQAILIGITVILLIARIGGEFFAQRLVRNGKFKRDLGLRKRLRHVDLFVSPKEPQESFLDALRSLFAVPLVEPVMLLFVPAAVFLFVPDPVWKFWLAAVVLIVWAILLAMAGLDKRLNTVLNIIRRLFFSSWMYWLSILVIVCAFLRWTDFKYVNIVLEGDPLLVWQVFCMAYLTLWVFQYWSNRFLNEALLDLFSDKDKQPSRQGYLEYETDEAVRTTDIITTGRKLQLHTGARFVTVGIDQHPHRTRRKNSTALQRIDAQAAKFYEKYKEPGTDERFQFYERIPLLDTLVTQSNKNRAIRYAATKVARANRVRAIPVPSLEHMGAAERKKILEKSINTATQLTENSAHSLRVLTRMIGLYFGLINFALLVLVAILFINANLAEKDAMIVANKNATGAFDLRAAIFDQTVDNQLRKKAVLVAASGGGTRAAVHAASVMDGLHLAGATDDLVLVSGISGGSVGLAYYAAHFDQLRKEPKFQTWSELTESDSQWKKYHAATRANYIHDVLIGFGNEWRVLNGRVTMGKLLAESLDAHFFPQADAPDSAKNSESSIKTFGECPFGIILNTTLTGSFPFEEPPDTQIDPNDRTNAKLAGAYHTGERLIFTNLKDFQSAQLDESNAGFSIRSEFPQVGMDEVPHESLRYIVVRDPDVELADAAAASANFPPVFPNAAVDLYEKEIDGQPMPDERHWITDGGTTDNRGILSLLFALRHALERQKRTGITFLPDEIPDIHIVMAEASATNVDYSHDQGRGAIINAKAKVANQLMLKMIDDVQLAYKDLQESPDKKQAADSMKKEIQIHYLSLPAPLRMRGGVGTHWMMPWRLALKDAIPPNQDDAEKQTLFGIEVARIMWELHRPNRKTDQNPKIQKVWEWIDRDPWMVPYKNYDERWQNTVQALNK